MRLIDVDDLVARLKLVIEKGDADGTGLHPLYAEVVLDDINRLPPIQPEIVRCKDCKYGILDNKFPHQRFCNFKGDEWNNDDYFCGHAKKREVTE